VSLIGDALERVLAAFDKLKIRYAAGGSVASSLRGNYRQTNDVDFLVEMRPDQVGELSGCSGPGFTWILRC
jgi:predicted nucleotidyltransferase